MILHRLRLRNFRGVSDREVTFPDRGVVVVCGPNEVGKSSMLEALDLLLNYRDRSNHRNVKQVKPAHADVGAEVEAEISTGPYRFVYRKRFHKKYQTELEVIDPRRESLTGDEAHEWVEATLERTLDTGLWDALRVLQSTSTQAVDLSGCDALSRALDAAAGQASASSSGTDPLLIDRIEAEYLRYFTATGRPSRDWKAARDRLGAAQRETQRCRAAVAEVDERVDRYEDLTATLLTAERNLGLAMERVATARAAHTVLDGLAEQLGQARLVAQAAAATSANSALANAQRRQLVSDADRRAATLAELRDGLAAAAEQEAESRQSAATATKAADLAAATVPGAQQRLDAARLDARTCGAREEAGRLSARLRRIDEASRLLAQLNGRLTAVTLTDAMLAEIERAASSVTQLTAQLQADAGAVEFTAPGDLSITVDGEPRTLTAGQVWAEPVSAEVTVHVPGVLSVRIAPGATAVKLQTDLQAAQQVLQDRLRAAGVHDLTAVRELDQDRRAVRADIEQATATLQGLCDGDDIELLSARLAQLQADLSEVPGPVVDAETAAADVAAAEAALDAARDGAAAVRQSVADATAALAEKATAAALLRDRVRTAEEELAAVCGRLVTLRAAVSDDSVAARADADAAAQSQADAELAGLAERYAAADPDGVEAELVAAAQKADACVRERDATKLALNNLAVELGVIGSEGRQGQLDEAEAELERARAEHVRLEERANAVQLLRDTMIRHRDSARQRYVQPYRNELERLGRAVFGPTFEVDIDTGLTICSRTLAGRTVPFESLSGGAREQMGILARLAGAALVAKEDTVPVVIDDALGFSDPERLDSMGAVLNVVGDRGQVIVLTCTPGRYDGVPGADVIELTA
ncbi:MAG: AAA family ATPase [Actinomycetia bacterium]|nr:AAA family ATPase [Actinomycetes bacterium]